MCGPANGGPQAFSAAIWNLSTGIEGRPEAAIRQPQSWIRTKKILNN
jgi:hypothetical protein